MQKVKVYIPYELKPLKIDLFRLYSLHSYVPGPHRSGDIADRLGRRVQALGPIRNSLIAKGMIWNPNHGDTAFTVPLFDEFMKRIMPGDEWDMAN